MKVAKSIRRERIFVDYLRNSPEQTSIAAYSTRAWPGAPVSTPIAWEELGRTIGGDQYNMRNLMKRLGRLKRDPWSDISCVQQTLPDSR
jgi:bifunctional non-homologous end joining protein LigD